MEQENKQLLLSDLCARLPYGVKCIFGVDDALYVIEGINPDHCGASEIQATHINSGINGDFRLAACKPYLFPLSSMTDEQKVFFKNKPIYLDYENDLVIKEDFYGNNQFSMLDDWLEVIYWCYKNHFDINGLIKRNLAIDATNLNIY